MTLETRNRGIGLAGRSGGRGSFRRRRRKHNTGGDVQGASNAEEKEVKITACTEVIGRCQNILFIRSKLIFM